MKKMFISLAVASASLFYSQIANADDGLSKEEAINVLNSATVDIHKYEEDMKDMLRIYDELERMKNYNYKGPTKEQLISEYNNNLREVKGITNKTFIIDNKEVKMFNENSQYGVKLSELQGDILSFDTYILNDPKFPEITTFNSIELHDMLDAAGVGLQNIWQIESEYDQTLDILKNSYERTILEGNMPLDTKDAAEIEGMLIEQVKGLNQILNRLYQNKEFAFQSINETKITSTRDSLDRKYGLNKKSMERTATAAYYKNISLLNDDANWQSQYTIINYESYLNVDVPSLKEKKLKVYNIDDVMSYSVHSIGTSEDAKEAYKETIYQIEEAKKARSYFVGLLEEMGSSKIPTIVEEPNFGAPEQNRKETLELINNLLSGLNSVQTTLKELNNIAYEGYINEEKKDNIQMVNKYRDLRNSLYSEMKYIRYNGINLWDENKDLNFYFNEEDVNKPSYVLKLDDLSTAVQLYEDPYYSFEEVLKEVKESEKIINKYKEYVLQSQSELNGVPTTDKSEVYNKKITVFEKLTLYRDTNEASKTNATVSPQTVNAFERKGDWIRIKSYLGDVYIKPTFYLEDKKEVVETKIEMLKRLHLHDLPSTDSVSNATVAPQQLYALYKVGDWYAINTWLGVKFVKPDFVEEEYNAYLTSTERLNLYNEPSLDSVNGGTLNPQTLKILKRKGEFLQVQTWMGPKYIKPAKDAAGRILDVTKQVDLTKRVSLHTLPGSDYVTAQSLAPQKVNVVGELSNGSGWTLIHTWLGNRWVKL